MASLPIITQLPSVGRVMRKPEHTFQLRTRPWQIQPFCIAPVLPGETLKQALLQVRCVTDPLKNPLLGWWCEHYLFYVKHRDLSDRALFEDMVLVQGTDLSSLDSAAKVATYHGIAGLDWVQLCLNRVTECYFRGEGEAINVAEIDSMPLAQVNKTGWFDSIVDETTLSEGTAAPGSETPEDEDLRRRQYEFMRAMQLTDMSYEDFLRTYGVRLSREENHEPELIRYVKSWTYPTNTVDPSSGDPSSAASWAINERADKDRFFKEPGFIFGVQVVRPKIYFSKQNSAAVMMLNDAFSWLPAILRDDPATSLKEFAGGVSGNGPLGVNPTNGYWVDVRDLFLYGDQFVNFALTATDAGLVALPTAALGHRYASSTDADELFNSAAPLNQVRSDGIIHFHILGTQTDMTPMSQFRG